MSEKTSDLAGVARNWWLSLQPQSDATGNIKGRGDPGALARLRRAADPVEALAEAQAIRLAVLLGVESVQTEKLQFVGALASVLAHVRDEPTNTAGTRNRTHPAQLLGPNGTDDSGVMSALRFQRLMAAETPDELMRQMRNVVKLLGDTANVRVLAQAMLNWNDTTRTTWTYNYWGAGFADPGTTSNSTTAESKDSDTQTVEAQS